VAWLRGGEGGTTAPGGQNGLQNDIKLIKKICEQMNLKKAILLNNCDCLPRVPEKEHIYAAVNLNLVPPAFLCDAGKVKVRLSRNKSGNLEEGWNVGLPYLL
jgi:hypothetical protein